MAFIHIFYIIHVILLSVKTINSELVIVGLTRQAAFKWYLCFKMGSENLEGGPQTH